MIPKLNVGILKKNLPASDFGNYNTERNQKVKFGGNEQTPSRKSNYYET